MRCSMVPANNTDGNLKCMPLRNVPITRMNTFEAGAAQAADIGNAAQRSTAFNAPITY
jgi:hypothetical protein